MEAEEEEEVAETEALDDPEMQQRLEEAAATAHDVND